MKKIIPFIMLLAIAAGVVSCNKDDDNEILPINNKCLKRTQGPNLVGNEIYFVYAMAMPYGSGGFENCTVEASIPGAEGTYLDNNSYHTNSSGVDVPVKVGEPSYTDGKFTTVSFSKDTCAAALRYHYVIPEEARGKEVTFKFSAKGKNGRKISMEMGPYTISRQYITRDITISKARCYISLQNMAAYTLEEAREIPDKIDLVYLWRNKTNQGIEFGHTFAAPAADKTYLDNMEIPESFTRDVHLRKEWGIIDGHLTDEPNYGTYIDDIDFETIKLDDMPDYCVNMKEKGECGYRPRMEITAATSISTLSGPLPAASSASSATTCDSEKTRRRYKISPK